MLKVEPQSVLHLENQYTAPGETPGEHLTLNSSFRRMAEKPVKAFSASFNFPLNQKAVLTNSGQGFQSVNTATGVFALPSQQPFVFQLLHQEPISTSFVSNWKEGGTYVDVADVAAENTAAPEVASWTFSSDILPVRKIFSLARASDELFLDLPIFQTFVNEKLVRATLQRLDSEIVNGDGTGSHMTGILASSPTVLAKGSLSRSDALLTALSRIRSIGQGTPSGIVMSHADALALQTDKATGNSYTASFPGKYTDHSETIYSFDGAPILRSNAIAAGNVLAGDWSGAMLFIRREMIIETSDTDADNWTKNVVTLRASLRGTLLCHTPTKFVSITGF